MKSAKHGAFAPDQLRETIKSFGRVWISLHSQFCSWCRAVLTEDDIDGYSEWCVELGKIAKHGPTEHRVPCRSCAGPAMLEVVDGVRFSPNTRPSTEQPDPWSRPRWSEEQREAFR